MLSTPIEHGHSGPPIEDGAEPPTSAVGNWLQLKQRLKRGTSESAGADASNCDEVPDAPQILPRADSGDSDDGAAADSGSMPVLRLNSLRLRSNSPPPAGSLSPPAALLTTATLSAAAAAAATAAAAAGTTAEGASREVYSFEEVAVKGLGIASVGAKGLRLAELTAIVAAGGGALRFSVPNVRTRDSFEKYGDTYQLRG